jgi:molecular chaperone DnaK (HSP70)
MDNAPFADTPLEAVPYEEPPVSPFAGEMPPPSAAPDSDAAAESHHTVQITHLTELESAMTEPPAAKPKLVPVPGPKLKVHEDCLLESVGFQFDEDFFFVMIHAGASLTTFGGRVFSTSADWQTELAIPVYAGTNSFASRNRPLGICIISGIPAGPRGKARVEIRFTACEDGTLSITAVAKDSGRELAVELRPSEG